MRRGRRNILIVCGSVSLLVIAALFVARCGSVISGDFTGDGKAFNFREPSCKAAFTPPPADAVDVRYLGSGGIYLGWHGNVVLLGPFFSDPGVVAAQFCKLQYDTARIADHLQNVAPASVRAILLGHSHYDHIGDIPIVARQYAPGALIYTNLTGTRMLAYYPDLRARTREVKEAQPIQIMDSSGKVVMNIHAVPSDHAPQLCKWRHWPCDFADCQVKDNWTTPFEQHNLRDFCGGDPFAYVIDLIEDGKIRYRIYYNDAAATAPRGIPTGELLTEHPYDLAIICMASYDFVDEYPRALLSKITPRHVILSHYENFFSKSERRWEFVPLLTDAKAGTFMRDLRNGHTITKPLPPTNKVCGPSTREWTMPVPGEQMLFHPD
jgi:L-ascorbate metabolism protein UlaG (beta-lactamase superfamily)